MPRLPRVARSTSIELTLYSLQNLGASNYAIANRFGVDEKSVRNILKNASITKKLRADAFAALPLEERENYAECLELVDVIAVLYACANEDISLEGIRRLFCLTPPAFKHILSNAGRYVDAWDQIVRSAVSDLASNQRVPALPQAHGNAATDGIAYRRLSANDRDVVLQLHEHENMPQREIARVMQIGRSTVNRVVANRPRVLQSIGNQPLSSLHLTDVACTTTVQAHYLGPMDVKCDWCGALHYAGEPSRVEVINGAATRTFQDCCCHGKLQCDPLPYPDELKLLITGQDARSNHFHQRIRNYNSACAFASINASTYNFPNNGAYCYKVHGAIINKFNEAARADPEERPAYGQLYVINAEDAVAYRMDVPANEGVDEDLLREIDALLRRVNEYAKAYHMMGEIEERYRLEAEDECRQRGLPLTDAVVPTVRLAFDLKRRYERSYNVPVVSEVAAVFVTHGGGEMPDAHIVVHPRGRRVRTLSTLSADLNPMCLPLLFPYGTRGWTPNTRYHRVTGKRERVSRREHTASLLAVREGQFNPIHFAGKLAQEYVVCQYVYLEADRMQCRCTGLTS
ncbi:Protein Y46B2A.2 [Aphelenchoides avenae]|nr:Protein Y46B2A.2 [Aphelenchus avenae]